MRHIYTNDIDYIAAESALKAIEIFEATTLCDNEGDTWEQIPDDDSFTVLFEEEEKENIVKPKSSVTTTEKDNLFPISVTAKASDWANLEPDKLFFISSEY